MAVERISEDSRRRRRPADTRAACEAEAARRELYAEEVEIRARTPDGLCLLASGNYAACGGTKAEEFGYTVSDGDGGAASSMI